MTQVGEPWMPSLCSMLAALQRVGGAQRAVVVHQSLGRQEQRQPARAGRRIGQPGEHEVDDVLRQVVVAPGDEDLLAGQGVAAVAVGLGARGDGAPRSEPDCGSVRFIVPVHSPETSLRQVERLLAVVAVDRQTPRSRAWVSMGQRPKAMLAACTISKTASSSALGRPWPPWVWVGGQAVPAASREGLVGVPEAVRRRARRRSRSALPGCRPSG